MQVCAVLALGTDSIATELLALSFASEIEGVSELALVAFLAQASLIMLAYQVTNTGTLVRWSMMPVGTGRAKRTVTSSVCGADGAVELGGVAIWRICRLEEG